MPKRSPEVLIAFGTLWTAYLWMLDETGSEPLRPVFPDGLTGMMLILAVNGAVLLLLGLLAWGREHEQ